MRSLLIGPSEVALRGNVWGPVPDPRGCHYGTGTSHRFIESVLLLRLVFTSGGTFEKQRGKHCVRFSLSNMVRLCSAVCRILNSFLKMLLGAVSFITMIALQAEFQAKM